MQEKTIGLKNDHSCLHSSKKIDDTIEVVKKIFEEKKSE